MVPLSSATESFWEVVRSDLDIRMRSQWVAEYDLLFFAEVNTMVLLLCGMRVLTVCEKSVQHSISSSLLR